MGALDNAVVLLNNPVWRQYMTAASAYVARQVYSEGTGITDHPIRLRLAVDVLSQPDLVASQLATLLGTDPELVTTTADPVQVDEAGIVAKVSGYWTALAHQQYPA